MAKGNNGNLLQHTVEAELAWVLCKGAKPLTLLSTHGMAPYEPFEERSSNAQGVRALDAALYRAQSATNRKSAVLRAYRATQASASHYPNSAEIIGALLGRVNLRGLVCEKDHQKSAALAKAWAGTSLRVHSGSWRAAMPLFVLPKPDSKTAWLISLDPYSFVEDPPNRDDAGGDLCPLDVASLEGVVGAHLETGAPGALAVFCYSLLPERRRRFDQELTNLSHRLGAQKLVLSTTAYSHQRHVGIVLCRSSSILGAIETASSSLLGRQHRRGLEI